MRGPVVYGLVKYRSKRTGNKIHLRALQQLRVFVVALEVLL